MSSTNGQAIESDRWVQTLEAAANATGRSEAFVRRLKALGCPAFRHGRINLRELEEYCTENAEILRGVEREVDAAEGVTLAILNERLRKLRIQNDAEEGRYVPREQVAEVLTAMASAGKATLQRLLEDDGPDRMVGRSREELRRVCAQIVDQALGGGSADIESHSKGA
jgi:hypothetical protein